MLYKRNKTGSIQTWDIEVLDNRFRTISGQLDGAKVTSEWTTCQGKNVGQSNETSPNEQARKEAEAKITQKLEESYKTDIKDINNLDFKSPMLAQEYGKITSKKPLKFPVYSNAKLDGMRMVLNKNGAFSRNGKAVVAVPHIQKQLQPLLDLGLEFDGELYNHELKDDFNRIISLVKKSKPSAEDITESEKHIQYWIYDLRSLGGWASSYSCTYRGRSNLLFDLFANKNAKVKYPSCRFLYTAFIGTQALLDEMFAQYLEDGFEGQMIRDPDSNYEFCRTKSLIKRKIMQDAEFEIMEVLEGKGNRTGIAGSITMNLGDGRTFESSIKGSFDFCKDLLDNKAKLKGKQATVKFQNLTPDGIPRFPIMTAIRDYE